jgi:hypothetical protein
MRPESRETARKELERDLVIPDYTEIVGATVGHLMSIAAEAVMAHLSTFIFLSHARQKTPERGARWERNRRRRIILGSAPTTMSGG